MKICNGRKYGPHENPTYTPAGKCRECKCAANRASDEKRRDAVNATDRAWAAKNRGKIRGYQRRRKYGITPEKLTELLEAQNGNCPGCQKTLVEPFHVDHCHDTGTVRGLLCRTCNVGMGTLQDDPNLLESLAHYLRDGRGELPWSMVG